MKSLLEQIYTILSTDTTLQSLLGNPADKGVYPYYVDQPERFPCVTCELISSSENTTPSDTQLSTVEFRTFSQRGISQAENINERVRLLLKYYGSDTPNRVYWAVKTLEIDNPANTRNLQGKIVRYDFYTRI